MTKSELRKFFLNKRKHLDKQEFKLLNNLLRAKVLDAFNYEDQCVHTFLSIEKNKEIDTQAIIDAINCKYDNVSWVIPKSDFSKFELTHHLYNEDTKIQLNQYGIPEPVDEKEVSAQDVDFIFVPLIIADTQGNRVGYGKGFYDRFLASCRKDSIKVGLSIFECIEKIDGINHHDIALDYVISPQKILRIN